MYKKRFAKWGFQKNSRRAATTMRSLDTKDEHKEAASRKASPPGQLGSIPAFPRLDHCDSLTLVFLTNVRTWSMEFFEAVQLRDGFLASPQQRLPKGQLQPSKARVTNFAFKIVIDLLDRGYGDLAGRMTRKVFLLVEDMLTIEAPALVWNLLEMMHEMVTLRHAQLFHVLLAHLVALADGRMPGTHPLPTMLRSLRKLVASLTRAVITPGKSPSSTSSLASSAAARDKKMTSVDPWPLFRTLPSLLERAWILNAEIIFDHLDPRLFNLYCCMLWDSCSIAPPASVVRAANQWFSQNDAQQMLSAANVVHRAEELHVSTPVEVDRIIQNLLTPRMDASPPRNYEMLRTSSIAALWERRESMLGKKPSLHGSTSMLLRMLGGLSVARILESSPAVVERSGTANCVMAEVPRLDAANVASAIRILIDLDAEHGGSEQGAFSDVVERFRTVVALREYGEGEIDPQVIQEMGLLRDALVAAGQYGEAQEVEQDAHRRMEKYIQDVPD